MMTEKHPIGWFVMRIMQYEYIQNTIVHHVSGTQLQQGGSRILPPAGCHCQSFRRLKVIRPQTDQEGGYQQKQKHQNNQKNHNNQKPKQNSIAVFFVRPTMCDMQI